MGAKAPELTAEQKFQQFNRDLNNVEAARVIVSVDFSQSNFNRAKGWGAAAGGKGSLHASGLAKLRDQSEIRVQSPYRRALELLSYRIFEFDKNPEGVMFLGFADTVFSEAYVTRETILKKYDELAQYFNNGQIQQQKGTDIASSIYRAIEHSVQKDEYTILVILTDGDIEEVARATQAITDASNFPISICTIGMGDTLTQDQTF